MPEYGWINCSDYGRGLNMPGQSFTGFWIMPPVLNISGLGISWGCEYARVTQGSEYAWISLNVP